MVMYIFPSVPAVDPTTGDPVPAGSSGQVYAITDTGFTTPLSIQDLSGNALSNVAVTDVFLTQAFQVSDQPQVLWKSGNYIFPIWSPQSMIDTALEAVANASAAADEAAAAAQQVADYIANGGGGGGGGGVGGVTDHGALSGLTDDDHSQYYNQTRGDQRYYTKALADSAINTAVSAASNLDRARTNHTGTQAQSTIEGLVAALNARPQVVVVNNGLESRPTGSAAVIWDARAGTDPINALASDLVITPASNTSLPGDSEAPTVPSNVAVSSITSSGFTVSWTASTDNVGVTGYEVQLNGTPLAGVSASTSKVITGLTPSTTYAVRVRARDAAGNWSALSTSINGVTSSAGASARHSIFGSGDPSSTPLTLGTDGTPDIEVGHGYYRYGSGTGFYANMRILGGRIWKPTGVTLPSQVTVRLYKGPSSGASTAYTPGTLVETKGPVSPTWADGWNEILFDAPEVVDGTTCYFLTYKFGPGASDDDRYLYVTNGVGKSASFLPAADGTKLAWSEASATTTGYTANFVKFGTNNPSSGAGSSVWYGIDIITDEG